MQQGFNAIDSYKKKQTMASNFTPLSSLSLSELDLLTMDTSKLAIASHLYPNLLDGRHLTPTHIAAIRININNHFPDPTSLTLRNITAIDHHPEKLISVARAYGQYRHSLESEQQGEVSFREIFFERLLAVSKPLTLVVLADCVGHWRFIERLEREGGKAQKEVLEKGWMAYQQVPEQVKRELGLLEEQSDDRESLWEDGV